MVKEHNVETEEKILKAARKILLENGKNGARMQAIADEAKVNKALLHYYFRSKDKLYLKVLDDVLAELLESVISKSDPEAPIHIFLKQFVTNHINFLVSHQEIIKFFLGEIATNHEKVAELMKKHFVLKGKMGKPVHKLIADRINNAVANGEIKPIDPIHLMINILSLDIFFFVISPMVHILLETPKEKQDKILEERAEHIFNFVWEAIRIKE